MPYYGECPYWEDESRDRLTMRCRVGEIRFPDLKCRRLVAFGMCSGDWKNCSLYRALVKAGVEPREMNSEED